MASPQKTPRGWRFQFKDHTGGRRFISWPNCSQKAAYAIVAHIEELVAAASNAFSAAPDTRRWLIDAPDELINKLASFDLCSPRTETNLGPFVDRYISHRSVDVKPSTIATDKRARRHLFAYFDVNRPLSSITPSECVAFRAYLLTGHPNGPGLGLNTANTTCRLCSQFFNHAKSVDLIASNPFASLPKTTRGNPDKFRFIESETITRVLDACPDAEWRLLTVLARYGGLRCPSEILALTWGDILWDIHRFRVRSSKTAHHASGGVRSTPLFPEIARELQSVFDQAEPGTEHVITRYRNSESNLRTQFTRIIDRAGVEVWPKLWQNLRTTRHMELSRSYPAGVVQQWLGHNARTSAEFYEHATDRDYAQASEPVAQLVASGDITGHHPALGTGILSSGGLMEGHTTPHQWAQQDSNL